MTTQNSRLLLAEAHIFPFQVNSPASAYPM